MQPTLQQPCGDVDVDYFRDPLLLAVVGGLHVFRTLENMRQALDTESSSSPRPDANSSLNSSSSVTAALGLGHVHIQPNCHGSCSQNASVQCQGSLALPTAPSTTRPQTHSYSLQSAISGSWCDDLAPEPRDATIPSTQWQWHCPASQHPASWEMFAVLHTAAALLQSSQLQQPWRPRSPPHSHPHAAPPHARHHRPHHQRVQLQLPALFSRLGGNNNHISLGFGGGSVTGPTAVAAAAQGGGGSTASAPALTPRQPHRQQRQQQHGAQVVGGGGSGALAATAHGQGKEAQAEGLPAWLQAATAAAGAASRTLAQVAIHPLDTLKTRLQVSAGGAPQLRLWRAVMSSPCTRPRALAAWLGPAGVRDVFLGLGAAVCGTLPASALYFSAEAGLRGWMAQTLSLDRESVPCRLVASAAAATLSALVRVPSDVIKHRVQAYAYPSSAAAARHILSTRGPAGLYAGFAATLMRDAPEIVIQFTVYRQLKALAAQLAPSPAPAGGAAGAAAAAGPVEHMAVGAAAGAAAALATTPLDVVKTQLQCGAAPSVGAALRGVLAAGGPRALFRGLAPRLAQTTLCSAIFFAAFEASKAHLGSLAAPPAAAAAAPAAPSRPLAAAAAAAAAPTVGVAALSAAAAEAAPLVSWGRSAAPLPARGHVRQRSGSGEAELEAAAADAGLGLGLGLGRGMSPLAPVAEYSYAYARCAAQPAQPGAPSFA